MVPRRSARVFYGFMCDFTHSLLYLDGFLNDGSYLFYRLRSRELQRGPGVRISGVLYN
jgi:hypothetical protein